MMRGALNSWAPKNLYELRELAVANLSAGMTLVDEGHVSLEDR